MIAQGMLDATQTQLIATFQVAGTLCGIDAMKVHEVVRLGQVTRVHQAAAQIVGIINLRGKIVTVLDLGAALELGPLALGPNSRVFIVECHGEFVGLLTDAAGDVVSALPENIAPPPANIHGVKGRYFEGVYPTPQGLIALLRLEAVLAQQDEPR